MERIAIKVTDLNRKIFDKASLYIHVCKEDTFKDIDFKDEYEQIRILFNDLNTIHTNDITAYFIKRCRELGLSKDVYIYMYFMFLIKKYNGYDYEFSETYKKNVDDLFYLNDIEAIFNKEKFRLHYRTTFTDLININNDLDSSVVEYVKNNLPTDLSNELELAIAIYVLVCNILQYDGKYLITSDFYSTNPFESISLDNPRGVCIQIAVIYYKLLKMYGIDCHLDGSMRRHLNVNLRIGSMMINADATKFGYYSETYNLSDLTNVKLGFLPEGFELLTGKYLDINYIKYNAVRMHDAIRSVYKKMGLSTLKHDKFEYLIDKMQQSEFGFNRKVYKEDIDRRVAMVNTFPLIEYSNVENVQYLSRIITSLFADIFDNRVENLMIYQVNGTKIDIGSILVVYDEDGNPYYYLLNNGKYVNMSVTELCNYMIDNNWLFKNGADIDALNIKDDKMVYKLVV